MTILDVTPLPVSNYISVSVPDSMELVGYVDDARIMQLAGGESSRAAKSPMRNTRHEGDSLDYAGWFSPFHATREMAFARG